MDGLEQVYVRHHTKDNMRKRNHAILASERKAFIQKYLGKSKNLLDIGCRDGELITHYNSEGKYSILGLDIDQAALTLAKQKTKMEVRYCDLNGGWQIEANTFDGVVACEVIEHLYHPDIVFEKIHNALKPGGVLVGSIPHAFNMQTRLKFLFGIKHLTPLADPTHINHFSVPEFRRILEKRFIDVTMVGITTSRYAFLTSLFPYLFSHTLLFSAKKSV